MSDIDDLYAADKRIVRKILLGDRQAFAALIKNTEGLVATIVFRLIPASADRDDLAQDIYLKAYQNLPGFRHQAKLSTWIGQIAYRTCLHYLEKKQLVLAEPDETLVIKDNSLLSSPTEQWLNRKESAAILQTGIGRLPPLYQTLLTLFHREEMSMEEIRQLTGLPEGTIKSYLYRARIQLKEQLLSAYKKEDL